MHYPLDYTNCDIKIDETKIRTQQHIQLNTGAKEIQQSNPGTHGRLLTIAMYHHGETL